MKLQITIFFVLLSVISNGQSAFVPLDNDYYHTIDRFEIKNKEFFNDIHTSVKPYQRKNIINSLQVDSSLSKVDLENLAYLSQDSWEYVGDSMPLSEKPILKHFYKTPSDLYAVNTPSFDLHINPVIYLQYGKESVSDVSTFINTRGVEIRGRIDKKVAFYSFLAENQAVFPNYVRDRIDLYETIPGQGFWKRFKTNGVDFFTARGYIDFNATEHINVQFGHDKNFIGNGYRSLILSDYAPNYLFLKLTTRVWKLDYTNIFGRMTSDVFTSGGVPISDLYPRKHLAFHRIGLNIGKSLNVGLFESIVYSRGDSTGNSFELDYLNPIIFYRSVEQNLGSQDNALLGLDFKWNFLNRFSLYGQVVLDEFLLREIKAQNGWWGNKQSAQIGLKYIDVAGIENLDIQVEANIVRPYMYSHTTKTSSYSHYNQSLAHPLGANFTEIIGIARYQPLQKLRLTGKLFVIRYGADTDSTNFGGNILKPNSTREQEFGNTIGQGNTTNIFIADFTGSYMLRHNMFVDLKLMARKASSDTGDFNTAFFSAAFRWNIGQRLYEF